MILLHQEILEHAFLQVNRTMIPRLLLSRGRKPSSIFTSSLTISPRWSRRSSLIAPKTLSPTFLNPLPYPSQHTRGNSTERVAITDSPTVISRLRNILVGTAISLALVWGYAYITDTRASFHLLTPSLLRWVYEDAEDAHEAGNRWLKVLYGFGLHPRERGTDDGARDLAIEARPLLVFGHTLSSPIGTSAGIDKAASIPDPLFALGPSIIEVGGATPYPQDGNRRPRVFRLPSQRALINRYGLNSEGADHMAMVLRKRVRAYAYAMGYGIDEEAERGVLDGGAGVPPGSLTDGKLLAVQVAKNKFTPDDDIEAVTRDYVYCVEALARYADIIVVNVSSPNTPGLRGLQSIEPLTKILSGVVEAAEKTDRKTKPAVMVKVSPDEDSEEQVSDICDAVWQSGVGGVIVGNTTKRRPNPLPEGYTLPRQEAIALLEQGGYSGPQLFDRTVALTRRYRRLLDDGLDPDERPGSLSKPQKPAESTTPEKQPSDVPAQLDATTKRDAANLKRSTPEAESHSESQPLIRLPERNNPFSSAESPASPAESPALSSSSHIDQLPRPPSPPAPAPPRPSPSAKSNKKIIFATGGIATGAQALEVLEAGASVAQVYTALVYGGAGTITRIKGEMKEEMKRRKNERAIV
ncbi:MAG: hypothetical protein Q9163_006300 [Psora crenata]